MKNILKLSFYSLVVVMTLLLSSCDDNSELFTVTSSPTAPVLAASNVTEIELDIVNIGNPAVTLSWSAAEYDQQAAIVYSVQFSSDEAFTNPYTGSRVVGRTNVTLTVNELNSAAGFAGLDPFQWATIYMRIESSLGTQNAETSASNVISFDVFPFFNYIYEDYYLVGNATAPDWNNNNTNPLLFRDVENPDVFYHEGWFNTGQFKLLEVLGQWQPQWGTDDGATIDGNPATREGDPERFPTANDAGVTTAGWYEFRVDFSSQTFTFKEFEGPITTPYASLTLQGSAAAAPQTMTQLAAPFNHLYYISNILLIPGEVQFQTNSGAILGAETGFMGIATENGGNIPVIVEDSYEVWFNSLTGRYILHPLSL